jgi:hypothetical protein
MPGTTSPAKPWLEQVASVLSETAGEVVPYEDCLKAAERIQKLNQPIDPNAALIGSAPGNDLLVLMVAELKRRLQTPSVVQQMPSSEFEMIRKLLSDNTVTLASIRRGDFGDTVKGIEEAYPFPAGNQESLQ